MEINDNRTGKEIFWGIVMSLLEAAVGVLIFMNPAGFTQAIIICFGALCLLYAVVNIITYFRLDVFTASNRQCLFRGLVAAAGGCFCLFRSEWFVLTFPIFTIIYGIGILVAGLYKVQAAADMLRLRLKYWYIVGISALISVIFALVILLNPFASTAALWIFVGITLVVSAVLDIAAVIADAALNRKKKHNLTE
ncbi:MAG: DUF308 domain-containing protein [Clostridiales bacterium]|nr:DUF308 domain-containing protein [Clostridiales bacterium]